MVSTDMAKPDSPLVNAAAAFDGELATYSRLGELFIKTPLNTLKHLERANQTLGELADSEQRLQDIGKALIEALTGARQKQEQLSQSVIDYAPTVQARNQRLRDLMTSMDELAGDVSQLNTIVTGKNGDAQAEAEQPDPAAVSTKVLALSDRADQLATSCRDADFAELAEQAHALHQRLKAIGTKLQKAGGN
jgi:DNA anti-recombination protein RmuC